MTPDWRSCATIMRMIPQNSTSGPIMNSAKARLSAGENSSKFCLNLVMRASRSSRKSTRFNPKSSLVLRPLLCCKPVRPPFTVSSPVNRSQSKYCSGRSETSGAQGSTYPVSGHLSFLKSLLQLRQTEDPVGPFVSELGETIQRPKVVNRFRAVSGPTFRITPSLAVAAFGGEAQPQLRPELSPIGVGGSAARVVYEMVDPTLGELAGVPSDARGFRATIYPPHRSYAPSWDKSSIRERRNCSINPAYRSC